MSIQDITNFKQVCESIASSGQPEESQFKAIAAAGYRVVINLAMPNSDHAIPEEGYIVSARRMDYVHLPIPFEAPTASHLKTFLALMEAFDDRKVWVHCVVNYRVSAFLYQYLRLVRGYDAEAAREAVFTGWEPDRVWREFMVLEKSDVDL